MKTVRPYTQNIKPKEPKAKLRVAAYCRVSTEAEEQSSSLALQKKYYTDLINKNPKWINAGIFAEAKSGLNILHREEFQKLLKQCEKGNIDLILTKSFTRFGRNSLETLEALQELKKWGVDVYFEKENLKTNQKQLTMLVSLYAACAQAESENASQNIKWGLHRGFESGNSKMANFKCFGYTHDEDGKIIIQEKEAEIVKKIFQMRAEGQSLSRISNFLYEQKIKTPSGKDKWSRETLNKLLRNEKYTGNVLLQKTVVEDLFTGTQVKNDGQADKFFYSDHHPAIIDMELYKKVNKEYAEQLFQDLERAENVE